VPAHHFEALTEVTIGAAPVRKKAATSDLVLGMVGGKGASLRELRNRAILLLGFAGAFRRSELVAEIACPVAALRAWLDAAGIAEGPSSGASSTSAASASPRGVWRLGMSRRS
jgi:hypothetical protein